jgi:hypothetical protein
MRDLYDLRKSTFLPRRCEALSSNRIEQKKLYIEKYKVTLTKKHLLFLDKI